MDWIPARPHAKYFLYFHRFYILAIYPIFSLFFGQYSKNVCILSKFKYILGIGKISVSYTGWSLSKNANISNG